MYASGTESNLNPDIEVISSPKGAGGRTRDEIWVDFDDYGDAKTTGHKKCKCKYCNTTFQYAKLPMMYRHISHECEHISSINPNGLKEILVKLNSSTTDTSNSKRLKAHHLTSTAASTLSKSLITTTPKCGKQLNMDQFGTRTILPSEKQSIDQTLVRAFVMNGMSFMTIDNIFFKEFLLKSYTDQAGRSLYEFNAITESRKCIVLALKDLSSHSHTAIFLHDELESVLKKVSVNCDVNSKVRAIVTDNPNVMKPNVIKHSYATRILSRLSIVTTYFNQSHQSKTQLKFEAKRMKAKKETLDMVADTRWTTVPDSLHSFLLLRIPLLTIVTENDERLPQKVKTVVNARNFFYEIENYTDLKKTYSKLIGIYTSYDSLFQMLEKQIRSLLGHLSIFKLFNENNKSFRDLEQDGIDYAWYQLLRDALIMLGLSYMIRKRFNEALKYYNKLLEMQEQHKDLFEIDDNDRMDNVRMNANIG
ncbi:unnamed protein product [Didymodactylos carnosus]|uniref:Uncharacterized protein n=2 Tax=Didymodactylos carnosus TaxID=1234261 RepID=A0A814S0H1_9BILA|nr:unnamed protein product [Didymodactylos carnosus]CAF3903477.1 unnamed protein product [Didymodactylos carnosus]